MKMKKVMAFALAGVMALSIAACGGGSSAGTSSGSDSGSADAGAASGALTINIWDANQQAGIQEICNDWTALGNPEVGCFRRTACGCILDAFRLCADLHGK